MLILVRGHYIKSLVCAIQPSWRIVSLRRPVYFIHMTWYLVFVAKTKVNVGKVVWLHTRAFSRESVPAIGLKNPTHSQIWQYCSARTIVCFQKRHLLRILRWTKLREACFFASQFIVFCTTATNTVSGISPLFRLRVAYPVLSSAIKLAPNNKSVSTACKLLLRRISLLAGCCAPLFNVNVQA